MKTLSPNQVLFLFLTFLSVSGHAQQLSSELTCRAKAKEIATQTYSGCVTEARNLQIDQIRKNYQKQLTELKSKYDRELKKVSGKGFAANTAAAAPKATSLGNSASTGSIPKSTKGIAKALPSRKEVKNTAPGINQAPLEEKTVTTPEELAPSEELPQNGAQEGLKEELAAPAAASEPAFTTSDGQTY